MVKIDYQASAKDRITGRWNEQGLHLTISASRMANGAPFPAVADLQAELHHTFILRLNELGFAIKPLVEQRCSLINPAKRFGPSCGYPRIPRSCDRSINL